MFWNTTPWTTLTGVFNQYTNNLDQNPQTVTTTNDVMGGGLNMNVTEFPILSLGYNLNTFVGQDTKVVDNATTSINGGLSYTKSNLGGNISLLVIQFCEPDPECQ